MGEVSTGQSWLGAISMKPSGTGYSRPRRHDQRAAMRFIGRQQTILQPHAPAQVRGPRNIGDEIIGR